MSTMSGCMLFLFTDTPTTEIYTLSLHDALPIYVGEHRVTPHGADISDGIDGEVMFVQSRVTDLAGKPLAGAEIDVWHAEDRKSTRLNSSHVEISYAVFCLKKKKKKKKQ